MIMRTSHKFDAAHFLDGPEEVYGRCRNLHGHTYRFTLDISGELDEYGWIVDMQKVRLAVQQLVLDEVDHTLLNDWWALHSKPSTAENVAAAIYGVLNDELSRQILTPWSTRTFNVERVELWETDNMSIIVGNWDSYPRFVVTP